MARAKRGDDDAVQFLYLRFGDAVRRCARSVLRDSDGADDVLQTTFLKLLTRIGTYEARDVPFDAWLLRVARNAALDEHRRRRQRPVMAALDRDGSAREDEGEGTVDVAALLRSLPAEQAEVLVLRHLVGLTRTETALRMRTTETAVDALQERARAGVRTALRRGGPARHGCESHEARLRRPSGARGRAVIEGLN